MKESKMKPELPIDRDKMLSLFEYRDGMIFWKKRPTFSVKVGDRAGYFCPRNRYRTVRVSFILYKEHRIIWVMFNGQIPPGIQIDHINGIRSDNRIENLREATISQNRMNSCLRKNNKSGFRGVYYSKHRKKWIARVQKEYQNITIGAYADIHEAASAYKIAAKTIHKEFAKIDIAL